jgi:diguanylate cyclase (GGDEF)-like protein/PAS domain S-box-containing protein
MLGILLVAAMAANIIALVFFPDGVYLPASIAVLLAARMFGGGYGLLTAVLANLYLFSFSPAPLPSLLWCLEPIFVGMLFSRGQNNIVVADLCFWLFFGTLLRFVPEIYLLGGETSEVFRGTLIQVVNGSFNALAAAFLYPLFNRTAWRQRSGFSFIETEMNILAGCFLIPAVLVVLLNLPNPRDFLTEGLEQRAKEHCLRNEVLLTALKARLALKIERLAEELATGKLPDKAVLTAKARSLLKTTPEFLMLVISDSKGSPQMLEAGNRIKPRMAANLAAAAAGQAPSPTQSQPGSMSVISSTTDASGKSYLMLTTPVKGRKGAIGQVLAVLDGRFLSSLLKNNAVGDDVSTYLVDERQRVIAGTGTIRAGAKVGGKWKAGTRDGPAAFLTWLPERARLVSLAKAARLKAGKPDDKIAHRPYRFILEISTRARQRHLQLLVLSSMAIMLLPALPTLFILYRIDRKVMTPFKQLATATENLPEKIRSKQPVEWPSGQITEFNLLCDTIKESAEVLQTSFDELENLKEKSNRMLGEVLAQHRWESFSSNRQLTRERNQRKRVEQLIANIEAAEIKYRFLIEKTMVGVFFVQDNRFTYVNPRFAEIFGYTQQEIAEKMELLDLVHPDDQVYVSAKIREQLIEPLGSSQQYEFRGIKKNGDVIHVEVLNGQGSTNGKPAIIGTLLDVTKRWQAEQTIHHLAFHDPLTELPNRMLFSDRLQQAIVRASRNNEKFALLFIDLDRFKAVNDSLGHLAGDVILREVGSRLSNCLRESDTVSRFGGDEFNILLPQVRSEDEVTLVAHKILKALQWPYRLKKQEVFLTGSIGIAMYPKDGKDAVTLTKNADQALYRAKDLGKNNYQLYSTAMHSRAMERMALENSLHRVFERQELRVHYQPQVDLASGKIVGIEALLRWQHPSGNIISPSLFIPLAEETGLIVPMGEWILRAACSQLREWQIAGFPELRLGVNVSSQQFQQTDLPELVAQILRESRLSPHCLNLEITETMVMGNVAEAIDILQTLREVGVTIAIDDFGTGFSSLSYLKDFPVDHLKIDRAFVQNLPYSKNEVNIARHIVELAHALNLKVIAEGVEHKDQLLFLKDLGCDEIQGFYFSKPLPAEEMTLLLEENRRLSESHQEASPV